MKKNKILNICSAVMIPATFLPLSMVVSCGSDDKIKSNVEYIENGSQVKITLENLSGDFSTILNDFDFLYAKKSDSTKKDAWNPITNWYIANIDKNSKTTVIQRHFNKDIFDTSQNVFKLQNKKTKDEIEIKIEKQNPVAFEEFSTQDGFHFNSYGQITGYTGNKTEIAIPETLVDEKTKKEVKVLFIKSNAFMSKEITSLTLPSTLIGIEDYAFDNNKLTTLKLPSGLKFVGTNSFSSNLLTTVNFSETSLQIIEFQAFYKNQITEVVLGESLALLRTGAFNENQILKIDLSKAKISEIENFVFAYNKIANLIIPDNIKVIKESAFINNQILAISGCKNLEEVEQNAFYNNKITKGSLILDLLKKIKVVNANTFANNPISELNLKDTPIVEIKDAAFFGNQLSEIEIPDKVTKIGDNAFGRNFELEMKVSINKQTQYQKISNELDKKIASFPSKATITER